MNAFDAEDSVWADLLWSAARRRDGRAIAVLADHCRRRDAEPVLRWLADGPGAYRWLAGRLLVEGVPADESHTAAFVAGLGHSLRGDLRVTHLAAGDFLDLAARMRIPAVREVLGAALQEAEWKWSWSLGPAIATALAVHDPETVTRIAREKVTGAEGHARVSAAGVLAKVDERYVAEAVDILRAVAGAERWHAVEVLVGLAARLTDDQVGQVAEMLRDVLRTGALPSTQVAVARLLARLGPRYTDEAVRLLRYLPPGEDDGPSGEGRAEAGRGLLEVDPPQTEAAVARLREVLADPYPNRFDQLHAAATLGGLGSRYEEEAADVVREVARAGRDASVRVVAGRTLAGLGRRYTAEAAGILRAVAGVGRPEIGAAAELAALGPPYTAEAAEILWAVLAGVGQPEVDAAAESAVPGTAEAAGVLPDMVTVDAERSVSAAWALANIGPRYVGEAVGALRRLLDGPALDADARVRIVRAVAELDRRHDDDIAAALRVVAAGTAKPFPLTRSLRALARDFPRHTAAVADTLAAVLLGAVTRLTPSARGAILGAVRELVELSAGHTAAAVDVLRAVINDPVDVSEQRRAAVMLAELEPPAVG